jgi:hypothetical protein
LLSCPIDDFGVFDLHGRLWVSGLAETLRYRRIAPGRLFGLDGEAVRLGRCYDAATIRRFGRTFLQPEAFSMIRRALAIAALTFSIGLGSVAVAHDATPTAMGDPDITFVLDEHNHFVTNVDGGTEGPSPGDVIIWGPNPLFDEANETDTGATTQGACTVFNEQKDCLLIETILFPDGSTLELQGIQPGPAVPSTRTIVGGSGMYLGAWGTVTVAPTEDLTVWTKDFAIWLP